MSKTSVLFICMGNICRSPLAEGLFIHHANRRGVLGRFSVDSAGTGGWHAGERPDPRSLAVAAKNGVTLPGHARQVVVEDFTRFDHLLCMDHANLRHLLDMGAPEERTKLMLSFDPKAPLVEVPDPYYGGDDGFDTVFAMLDRACDLAVEDLLAGSSSGRRA